jgi:glutamate-ammonia-ligase adenylyltransferase
MSIEPALIGAFERLHERTPEAARLLREAGGELAASAGLVLSCSEFVLDTLARDPGLVPALGSRARERLGGPAWPWPLPWADPGIDPTAEAGFMALLRRWRRAELARIAWRDLAGWASLDETLADLSAAADHALRLAHDFALRSLTERHGLARSEAGELQQLLIVAMGKLGGGELNFSSDVDLVLVYGADGETERALSNHEFFTRLAQRLVRLLAQPTAEGWVYRVDLRLRPFGESGPTVCSSAALEDYLQIHGRDWERYAWVKARPVTAQAEWDQLFQAVVRPFVYRRYLDFGVLESLREMKALIEREVRRRDLADDIKLGDGGIREIEFIVQSFQLIRGGQDRRLQHTSLRHALPLLAGAKLLPGNVIGELDRAYVFLRRLENRLQMWADQQTHRLPGDAQARERLALSMGCDSWAALHAQLQLHRACVSEHFQAVAFGARPPPSARTEERPAEPGEPASLPTRDEQGISDGGSSAALEQGPALNEQLRSLGYPEATAAARELEEFQHAMTLRRLDEIGRRRLQSLLFVLVTEAARLDAPLIALRRLLRVLEAIGARSSYFALLLHHERPRARLLQLAAHGEFLIAQIATHPLLLDELIDERLLEHVPDRAALAADLEHRMAGADQSDEEQLLERLRQFQRAALFRIAVADLLLNMPIMRVSDRLTDVAELIVERALSLTWQHLSARMGTPMCGEEGARRPVRVAVIGYGKLGGMELGYASDLDLVFLHDSTGTLQETDAARPVDNQVFFVRFAQRLVHLLTVHSPAGRLYEVDMRLRPSGRAGLLVTSIEAFADYQRREAWTYEHQALLHARAVAGDAALRARFESLRCDLLAHAVHRERLREDVRDMRQRMRRELSRAGEGEFDLKQDPGGIADIEFLAQYWALRWAQSHPPVAMFADTIRQLESVGSADLIPQTTIDTLTGAYRIYRACLHHRALAGLGGVLPGGQLAAERVAVLGIWRRYMEDGV